MLRSGFAAASRGWLPPVEPPAVLYKAQGWTAAEMKTWTPS
jgi:hypothetical protein